ncbi:MAG: MBL fold metallo-hydrolase [Firmicutes bacterium]|nr:MBL fold metallo-hydrolase [Bacillota bacterium]
MQVNNSIIIPVELGHVFCFLIKGEKTILVDTGVPGCSDKIFAKMNEVGIKPEDVSLILITHGHLDHYGSLAEVQTKIKAKVAIQRKAADSLRTGTNEVVKPTSFMSRIISILMASQMNKKIPGTEPEIIFKDKLDLNEYGVKGQVISTPGHTPGSVSVILENGETIVGDMIGGKFSKPSEPTIPFFAADLDLLKKNVHKVLEFEPMVIYASHGGPFSTEAVKKYFA